MRHFLSVLFRTPILMVGFAALFPTNPGLSLGLLASYIFGSVLYTQHIIKETRDADNVAPRPSGPTPKNDDCCGGCHD